MHSMPNFNLSMGAIGGALGWRLGRGFGIAMLFMLVLSMLVSPVFGQQDSRRRLTISAIANDLPHELAKEVVRAAYEKMGMEVEFMDLPARRGLEWANSGKTDGDLARIDGTEKNFP